MKPNSKVKLTEEEEKLAINALNDVWQYIAGDCLVDENGHPDESKTLPRRDVFELCMDANRPSDIGKLSRELEQKLYDLSPAAQRSLAKKAFPYGRYGW